MLYDILTRSAERFGDHTAVVSGTETLTYRALLQRVDTVTQHLYDLGLRRGDRLSLYLYNRPELITVYFACFRLGITAVPVNCRLMGDEARYIINHSRPRVLISEPALFGHIAPLLPELPSLEHLFLVGTEAPTPGTRPFSALQTATDTLLPIDTVPGSTDAVILYTSGTTGAPKGAVLEHRQMMLHTEGHCKLVGYTEHDRTLVCLALSNNFAFSHQMLSALQSGAALVLTAAFDPDEVLEKIETEAITMLYMMPVMFHALNKAAEAKPHPLPNRLRLAVVAGDTTPRVVYDRFTALFGLEPCEGIGQTETQIYALNPVGEGKKFGSVGLPTGYTEVSVRDGDGHAMPPDTLGEICVRGPIVLHRYLDNPEANASSFRNGWFLTGDLGTFDDKGHLWFRGRRKQLIVHDGHNISPQEVEEVFYHHPAVFEVGVFSIPDAIEGENIHAFVALKTGASATAADLLTFAREHIADYKLPETITFIDTLPKGTTGKIDRRKLRELFAHG